MLDFGILALALYYYYIKQQRAKGRVNKGNRKQYCISLCLRL